MKHHAHSAYPRPLICSLVALKDTHASEQFTEIDRQSEKSETALPTHLQHDSGRCKESKSQLMNTYLVVEQKTPRNAYALRGV
jgi:hypothetical protein